MMLMLCLLLFLLEYVAPFCPLMGYSEDNQIFKRSEKCIHERSKSSSGAGRARNVVGRCRYDENTDNKFYYEITWEPPLPGATPVSEYAVKIVYYGDIYVCFRVPASQHRILFNESTGLRHKCWFTFSVTPQPVLFVNGTYRDTDRIPARCPMALQMKPLPSIVAHEGANVSFTAEFFEKPTPHPEIRWYFSGDKLHCRDPLLINGTERHLLLSSNRMILTVLNITAKQKGCYTVQADGEGIPPILHEQRGYVDLT